MEDEDLVVEGSALYIHLKDTGFNDFEAKTAHEDVEHETQNYTKDSVPLSGGIARTFSYWKHKLNCSTNQQRWRDVQRVVEALLDSRVLLAADCELIKEWIQPQEYTFSRMNMGLLALSAGMFVLPLQSIVSVRNTALLNAALVSAIKMWEVNESRQLTMAVRRYIQTAEELVLLLNKSIRLLQEKIVVARGFTFAVGGSWGKEEEENSSGWYYCSSLRNEVHVAERSVLDVYRSALSKLLSSRPLPSHLDHSEQYVTLHSQEQLLSEQPQNLAKLKQGVGVVSAIQSEVVRRLILCFVPELSSLVPSSRFLGDFMCDLTWQLDAIIKQLSVVYRYSRAPSNTVHRKEDKQGSPEHVFYLPIRSLSLHLEAALSKLHGLEDSISKKQVNQDVLEESLKRCKLELDACCVCYDDALQSLKLKSEEESCPRVVAPAQIPNVPAPNGIPFQPYVAQDEVFEATVSEQICTEEVDTGFDFASPQDREKRKKEKEYVTKVFGELKSVLVGKAAEWKKREDVAIARLKQERREEDSHSREEDGAAEDGGQIIDDESGSRTLPERDDELEAVETQMCRKDVALNGNTSVIGKETTSNQNSKDKIICTSENDSEASINPSEILTTPGDFQNLTNISPSTLVNNNVNTDSHASTYTPLIIAETNTSSCADSDDAGTIMPTRRRRSLPRRTRPPQRKALVNLTSSENSFLQTESKEIQGKPCIPAQSLSSLLAAEAVAKSAMFKVLGEEESFGGDSDSD